ncbi:hypothetical protein V5O48_017941 [Marasmius crinis-equi]|uniref:Uncharacterized protein n=1 Tax=Marasmius crinis-equi TaxID=585013 RepID=A0ABR3EMK9_9AGAR
MFVLLWLDALELQGKDGDEIRRMVTLFMLDHGHTPRSGKAVYRTYLMIKGLHGLQDVDAGLIKYHLAGLEVRLNVHILYSESLEGTATEILRLTTSVLDLYENPQLAYEARISSYASGKPLGMIFYKEGEKLS